MTAAPTAKAATIHERGQLPVDLMLAAVDEHGLLPLCCSVARSDGFIVGIAEGHAAGRQEVLDGIDASVAQVIRGAVKGIDVVAARAKADARRWSA